MGWFIHLKPGIEIQSQAFQQTWTSVVRFCNEQSGAQSAGHSLWQDTLNPSRLVFISGYPSQECTDAADARYVQEHMKSMMEHVESDGFIQLNMDVKDGPYLTLPSSRWQYYLWRQEPHKMSMRQWSPNL